MGILRPKNGPILHTFVINSVAWLGPTPTLNFCQSPRKGRYIYVLTPSGLEACARLAKRFLQRRLHEYDELVAEIERLKQEAGEE
mgnify:CR=1